MDKQEYNEAVNCIMYLFTYISEREHRRIIQGRTELGLHRPGGAGGRQHFLM